MRFKQPYSPPPTVNLIPMLDVMMTVLTFFIVLSMVLGRQSTVEIALPSPEDPKQIIQEKQEKLPDPLVIDLASGDKFSINKKAFSLDQVLSGAKDYLAKNPKGVVLIKPHPDLPYEKVLQALGELRQLDSQRVSLGIDGPEAAEAAAAAEGGDEAAPAEAPAEEDPAAPPTAKGGEAVEGEAPSAEGAEAAPAAKDDAPAEPAEDAPAATPAATPAEDAPATEAWPED